MITKHFNRWLQKNLHLFKYKPIQIGFGEYRFDGIIDNITLFIDNNAREVDIYFHNDDDKYYDHRIMGYIAKAKHIRTKGYIDIDDKNRFHPTYKDMIIDNLFLPIVNYCNEYFLEDSHLYLVDYSFSRFAMVGNKNDGKEIKELEIILQETGNKLNQETDTKVEKIDIFKVNITKG